MPQNFFQVKVFSVSYSVYVMSLLGVLCVCFANSETDKKSAVDQAFRDELLHLIVSYPLSCSVSICYDIVDLTLFDASKNYCFWTSGWTSYEELIISLLYHF